MPLMMQNFLLFQAGWFACVLGGATHNYAWAGTVAVLVIVVLHLMRAGSVREEALLVMFTVILGAAWDSVLMNSGLLVFSHGLLLSWLVPHWMIAMWALFATTLNVSMKWLKGRYLLGAVFGGIGGPIAYYAGHRLGAVEFGDVTAALLAVGAGWAVIMPVLTLAAERYNGYAFKPANAEVNA